jgi:VWFA-related protein
MRTRVCSMLALSLLMLAQWSIPPAAAQDRFAGEASVTVVEVPVRVVDRTTGRPVVGLTATDFVVLENGRPMEISNFAEIGGSTLPVRGAAAADLEEHVRQMVFFFDLFLMKGSDRDRAVRALDEAIGGAGVAPNTEVSIVSFDGTLRTHLDRSRDARRVRRALIEVGDLRARGLEQRVSFTDALSEGPVSGERDLDYYERRQRSREYMVELERRVSRVGGALKSTMARFARADGRRVVVAFTPGQPETAWSPSYSPVDFVNADARYPAQDLWHDVALEAADLGYTLYVVDSSGLRTSIETDAEVGITDQIGASFAEGELFGSGQIRREDPSFGDIETDPSANVNEARNLGQWIERTRKNLLIMSAELTGGEALFVGNPGVALLRVREQLDHWYSLGYTAPHGGDGKEYQIEVRVQGRRDLVVQHRTSYVDRSASQREAEGMRSAMLFGADANPLGIRVESGESDAKFALGRAGSKIVRVPVAVKIPIGRLDLVPRGDVYWGKVLITFFGEDAAGNQSTLASNQQPITVPADQFHKAVSHGYFTYRITVEIEGGEQVVYVGVRDEVSTRTSYVPLRFDH